MSNTNNSVPPKGTVLVVKTLPVLAICGAFAINTDEELVAGEKVEGGIKVKDASGHQFSGVYDPSNFHFNNPPQPIDA